MLPVPMMATVLSGMATLVKPFVTRFPCRAEVSGRRGERASPSSGDSRSGGSVTAGLARASAREQPQLPRALHRRGAVLDTELGVDAADVLADGAHRPRQLAGDLRPAQVPPEIPEHPQLARAELLCFRRCGLVLGRRGFTAQ